MKAVIFDMDGTMFNSEIIWQDMWKHLPPEYGYDLNPQLGIDISGTSGLRSQAAVSKHYPELDAAEFVQRGLKRYHERITEAQPEEKPGLREMLDFLTEKGMLLAIASSSEKDVIELNLKRGGLTHYFSAVVSGQGLLHGKPDPDIFLKAAAELKLPPEECIVFEDSPNGIRAAFRAGCTPIMIPDTEAPDDEMREISAAIYPSFFEAIEGFKKVVCTTD